MDNDRRKKADELRNRALARLNKLTSGESPDIDGVESASDIQQKLLELNKQKHELELQNTELQQRKALVETRERQYRSLLEFTPTGLFISDVRGVISELNSRMLRLLMLPRNQLLGHAFAEFAAEGFRDEFRLHSRQVFAKRLPATTELALQLADGTRLDVQLHTHPYQYPDREGDYVITAVEDITERKKNDLHLQLAAAVFAHVSDGFMITGVDGAILDVNDAFSQITGYSKQEAIGKKPGFLRSARQTKDFYKEVWQILQIQGEWHGEVWNCKKSGNLFCASMHINAIKDANGVTQQFVILFSDNSRQEAYKEKLERMVHFDVLTDLPNRSLLLDRLQQAMALGKRRKQLIALAFIDLDGFKQVNDGLGHDAGDEVLVCLSLRFQEALRAGDTIARLGGDEFVAMFVGLNTRTECIPLVKRLLEQACIPIDVRGRKIILSGSIGITFYPQAENVDPGQLLKQADQAMYQAKLSGKNQYKLFNASLGMADRGLYESRERIRKALGNREIVLYYQPKVNMRTGQVVGVEALIRWQHPERGLLSPETFFLPIENDPLANEIELWVINEAIKQISLWLESGLRMSVSVNIGPWHLEQNDFVALLQSILGRYPPLPANLLELELLESSFLLDVKRVANSIRACSEIGVCFALDDFGTGYSSLTHLRQLPVQTLKVDQSFVRNMLDDPEDLAILNGVIGLSRAFEKKVIAEGAESGEHCEILLQLGCELVQGFGIARPMAEPEFRNWLKGWRPDPDWQKVKPVSFEHHSLLIASVRHQVWLRKIKKCLAGKQSTAARNALQSCRFGHWLENEGKQIYGNHPRYNALTKAHSSVHQLVAEFCSVSTGREAEIKVKPEAELQEKIKIKSDDFNRILRELCSGNGLY